MKGVAVMLLAALVLACSPAELAMKGIPALLGSKDAGISAEANIGGEVNKLKVTGTTETNEIEAENVTITKVIQQNYSLSLLIIAVLGWVLPTPGRMFNWVLKRGKNRGKSKRFR